MSGPEATRPLTGDSPYRSVEGASLVLKRLALRTTLGVYALATRNTLQRVLVSLSDLEGMGTIANDHLAEFLVTRLCREGRTFVDVGAHVGSIVAQVARRCPTATIVAIEAMPDKAAHLARLYPGIVCHACAASDVEGEATFFVDTMQSGFSSLRQPGKHRLASTLAIQVPLRTLDSLLPPDGVDTVKIDVEGAELGVLRGAERLVATSRPTVMFESGPVAADPAGEGKAEQWQWLTDRRYVVLVPNRVAHDGQGLSLDGFMESHLYPRRATNYFAVAEERRLEIRDRARVLLGI